LGFSVDIGAEKDDDTQVRIKTGLFCYLLWCKVDTEL